MGEIPIFTSRGHVFVIDPVTKKSWIPASKSLVQVNFFFDSTRKTYRIISVEDSKAVINSTMVPDMVFTKTSGKFGQWADTQAGIVYGLGFSSDSLLNKFAEQFEIIREKAKKIDQTEHDVCENNEDILTNTEQSEAGERKENGNDKKPIMLSEEQNAVNEHNQITLIKKLTQQNDTLKESLQKRGEELKQCKTELDSLKVTNKKLTSTLQESMAKANDWHKKLNTYKEENDKYQKKVQELEEENHSINESVSALKTDNELLQKKNNETSQECSLLQQRIGVLSVMETQHDDCAARIKNFLNENQQLQDEKLELQEKVSEAAERSRMDQIEVRKCCVDIATYLTYITEATQKLQNAISIDQ